MSKNQENKIRAFVCLELPENIRAAVDRHITGPLKETGVKCSWVKPDNIHLTLKFLGDVPEKMIPKITDTLKEAISKYRRGKYSLSKVGTFGGRRPRVVWAGIDGNIEAIAEMAKSIDNAMAKLGFEREKRKFSPHFTVGRIRKPQGTDRLLSRIKGIKVPSDEFDLGKVILMKSVLSPGGSIYTPLAEFVLGSSEMADI